MIASHKSAIDIINTPKELKVGEILESAKIVKLVNYR